MTRKTFDSFLDKIALAKEKGLLSLSDDNQHITYNASRKFAASLKNPEEAVRASYFVELVIHYKYPRNRIDFEVLVPRRTPEDRADIVIFEDDDLKHPYLVVECKRDGITDAEFKQAIEQAFGNANSLKAKFAAVIAGNTRTAFDVAGFAPLEREKNVISDIPEKYGKAPKYRFAKGDPEKDLKPVSRDELIRALEKCKDTVWQGGKLAPTDAFDEVSKLLFCKLKDEKEETRKGGPYQFQIGTHEKAVEVFERVNAIYQKAKQKDPDVFEEDIKLEPPIVYGVVEHLQGISLSDTTLDVKGVAFERFMQDFFKGEMGQYFTPREIVQFCVKLLHPEPSEKILDPACGSGGFLLHVLDFVRKNIEHEYDEREAWQFWHNFARNNLYGIEINDQIARVCKMNMILHEDGHTNIISTDALRKFAAITQIHKAFKPASFDIILTNPPFGASVKSVEKDYLGDYVLGAKETKRRNQNTEILFIERCIDFLRPDGKMAIVLPDGILTNSSLQYVRDFIVDRCQILGVVSLPNLAFMHFGAGVKSSLLFLRRKGEKEKLGHYKIFMANAEHIGYDATGRKDEKNDLNFIVDEYRKFWRKPQDYASNETTYLTDLAEVKGKERLDAYYFHPEFKRLEKIVSGTKYALEPLFEVVGISGQTVNPMEAPDTVFRYVDLESVDAETGKIYPKELKGSEAPSRARMLIKTGDLLLSSLAGSIGKIALVPNELDGQVASTGFHVIRKTEKIENSYLFSILKTKIMKKLLEREATGAIMAAITEDRFRKIKIPVPPLEIQRKISRAFSQRIESAFAMQEKAKAEIAEAEKDVEEDLFARRRSS